MFGRHIQVRLAKNEEKQNTRVVMSKEEIDSHIETAGKTVIAVIGARLAYKTLHDVAVELAKKPPVHIHL